MANMIRTSGEVITPKSILFMTQPYAAVGVVVSDDCGVVDSATGRKIVKAGTPLAGDLTSRVTPFGSTTSLMSNRSAGMSRATTRDGEGGDTPVTGSSATVQGVLVHDVDVTEGDANGTLCIFGFIDLDKLDSDVVTLANAAAAGLDGKIWFLRGM